MPLFRKAPFQGKVDRLLVGADRAIGLEKSEIAALTLTFAGIDGDCHAGLTRKSDSRTLMLYRRDTDIRNVRQLSLLSVEELADTATGTGIAAEAFDLTAPGAEELKRLLEKGKGKE